MEQNNLHQSYLKDCDCKSGGVIMWNDKPVCRWCGIPYAKGGSIFYLPEYLNSKQQSVSNGNDWEITEFISSKIHVIEKWQRIAYNDGRLKKGVTVHYDEILKNALAHNLIEQILQVKRLSDNEVFTIGDKIGWGEVGKYETKITSFGIKDERLEIGVESILSFVDFEYAVRLHKKAKQILFTTHDNVSIYEGQNYWRVLDFNKWLITNPSYVRGSNELYFSTEDAADEYILLNKPCLSVNDVFNVLTLYGYQKENIISVAKSKIKNQ